LVLGLLTGVSLAGCENTEIGPEDRARRFAAAVRSANAPAVLDMLDAETRTHVDRTAQIATDRVGGRRVVETSEVFQITGVDRSFDVASTKLLSSDPSQAQVELISPSGQSAIIDLRYEEADGKRDAGWRVHLPLPEGMTALRANAG
jgi:hypothetical protein